MQYFFQFIAQGTQGIGPAVVTVLGRSLAFFIFFVIVPAVIIVLALIVALYLKGANQLQRRWWVPTLIASVGVALWAVGQITS